MKESDIIHENGGYWVCKSKASYDVMDTKITHSETDSSYEKTPDGLSIAIARCNYLAMKLF